MNVLIFILQKEFRQIFRDKIILAMMTIVPIVQLTILPLAANFDVTRINIACLDHDHSPYSTRLIDKVASSGFFRVVDYSESYRDGMAAIRKGNADLILEIPAGFERNLVRQGREQVNIVVDAINGTKSSLGGTYLLSVIGEFNANLDINIKTSGTGATSPAGRIEVTSTNWFNPLAEYKFYMVPGILVLLLTLIGGFLTALNIVREKEIGTIEQINVTPIRKWQFILGKLIPFWIVGIVVFTVGLTVMYVVYGIFPKGSLLTLYLFAGVYLIALMGFGLLISTLSNTQLQAMFVAFFFIMIFTLMSGLFTSIESMPDWALRMAQLTPVTHFINVMRLIVLKGSGLSNVYHELLYLLAFAVALNGLAIWNYRKTT